MTEHNIKKIIKEKRWDLRVRRPGFLQPKQIVSEALTQPIKITPFITIHDDSNIWIDNINLYNQNLADNLTSKTFAKAFAKDPQWPLKILKKLKDTAKEKDTFIQQTLQIQWANANTKEKIQYFKKYVEILFKIQKY